MAQKARYLPVYVLILMFAFSAMAQIVTPLEIVSETRVPKDVYDAVAIGLLEKQIQCDPEENIWIPALRGYSDTFSSLVRFGPKRPTIHIDIDENKTLENGSIEFFSPLKDGGALALVRTVAEYNQVDGSPASPKRFLNTFAATIAPSGKISSLVQLKLPSTAARVTALAPLKDGWLVAGYTQPEGLIEMHVYLFDKAGAFRKELQLPENRSRFSRTGTAESTEVFRPAAVTQPNGDVLVLRGFTSQLLYRFSETGELMETKKLQPDGMDFATPRLAGNMMLVHIGVPDEKIAQLGETPILRSRGSAYPIFDLTTGAITEVLTWKDEGAVSCFNGNHLVIFSYGDSGAGDPRWKIVTLKRAVPKPRVPKI